MAPEIAREEILAWLRCDDSKQLEHLWKLADRERSSRLGNCVHLRGLIEISNHCARSCHYCGISTTSTALKRYRMQRDEIMACARMALEFGYGTIVLQAGEDPGLGAQ